MLTIPESWKNGSTNRDDWINVQGTPVWRVRIFAVDPAQTKRITNIAGWFIEEDGQSYYYSDTFFKSISSIEERLNYSDTSPGFSSQMNNFILSLASGSVDDTTLLDGEHADSLLSAIVDVWLIWQEITHHATWNALKHYKGRISNFVYDAEVLQYEVEEFSDLKQTKTPKRVVDIADKYTTGWNLPDVAEGRIVPINFGNVVSPMQVCDCQSANYYRRVHFITAWPLSSDVGMNHVPCYWDSSENVYVDIPPQNLGTNLWFELNRDEYDTRLIEIADMIKMPKDMIDLVRITPGQVLVLNSSITDGNPEAFRDIDLNSEELLTQMYNPNCARVHHNNLTTSFQNLWQVAFSRSSLPEDTLFNVYLVFDFTIYNQVAKTCDTQFYTFNIGFDTTYMTSSGYSIIDSTHLAYFAVPDEYAPRQFYPDLSDFEYKHPLKLHVTRDAIWESNIYYKIAMRRNASYPGLLSTTYQWHELYLLILPLIPTNPYYVRGNWGHGSFQSATQHIFDNVIELSATDYLSFSNFARDYDVDGSIDTEMTTFELLTKFANEFGAVLHEDCNGITRYIDLNGKTPDYTIYDDDLLFDEGGKPCITFRAREGNVYSKFRVDYARITASGKYKKSKYINPLNNNLVHLDATPLTAYCISAQSKYGTNKELVVKCDLVKDDITAEEILRKCVILFYERPTIVSYTTSMRLVDLQIGDHIKHASTFYTHPLMHMIIGKRISGDGKTIEFDTLELFFYNPIKESGAQDSETMGSAKRVAIDEHIAYYCPLHVSPTAPARVVARTIDPSVNIGEGP